MRRVAELGAVGHFTRNDHHLDFQRPEVTVSFWRVQRETAESWIRQHGLSGTLTAYPMDVGTYNWAVSVGHFTPTRDDQRSAEFIQRFSSATQEHYHYELGNAV